MIKYSVRLLYSTTTLQTPTRITIFTRTVDGPRMKNKIHAKKVDCSQERHPANNLSFYGKLYFNHPHYYTAIAVQHAERNLKQISPKQIVDASSEKQNTFILCGVHR